MSSVQLVNLRNGILDLSAINDVNGARVVLQPQGTKDDSRECDKSVEEHADVVAMIKAGWLRIDAASLEPSTGPKLTGAPVTPEGVVNRSDRMPSGAAAAADPVLTPEETAKAKEKMDKPPTSTSSAWTPPAEGMPMTALAQEKEAERLAAVDAAKVVAEDVLRAQETARVANPDGTYPETARVANPDGTYPETARMIGTDTAMQEAAALDAARATATAQEAAALEDARESDKPDDSSSSSRRGSSKNRNR